MKAVLVLAVIYIGTFFVAIQGSSQNPVRTPQTNGSAQAANSSKHDPSIDPGKETDILSLMELTGVHDAVQDANTKGLDQFRQNLQATTSESPRGEAFLNAFLSGYQKKFSADEVTAGFAQLYDKHFTDEDIKGLLQFYGSPLGQKYAAEMPKLTAEGQALNRAAGQRIAKEVLQDLKKDYPGIAAQARLNKPKLGPEVQQVKNQPTQP